MECHSAWSGALREQTKGRAENLRLWVEGVIEKLDEPEVRHRVDSHQHVIKVRQPGFGKKGWEVGWPISSHTTDKSFGAGMTAGHARHVEAVVNSIVEIFAEERAETERAKRSAMESVRKNLSACIASAQGLITPFNGPDTDELKASLQSIQAYLRKWPGSFGPNEMNPA